MSLKETQGAFRTHANYILALATLIESTYTGGHATASDLDLAEGLYSTITLSKHFERIQHRRDVDFAQVRKSLANAWGTELMLLSTAHLGSNELLGVANNWAVVQAYYACFQAVTALAVARRAGVPDTHEKARRSYIAHWITNDVKLPPWSLAASTNGPKNFPVEIADIHHWAPCDEFSCAALVYKAFRTTRQDTVEKKIAARRMELAKQTGQNHIRVSTSEKSRIDATIRDTSLLDYLYRLRIRSNYTDCEMFTTGPIEADSSRTVNQGLRTIASSALLLHEIFISRIIGNREFRDIAESWVQTSGLKDNIGIGLRLGVHRQSN